MSSEITRHLAGCTACEDFIQKFLHREPKTDKITVRTEPVKRWTANGPTTSLHEHPHKGFFIEALRDAIESALSTEEKVVRILYFEYSILAHNHYRGERRGQSHGKRFKRKHRHAGSDRRPWGHDEILGQEDRP